MNLVLLSGGTLKENKRLHLEMGKRLSRKNRENFRVTFVPSSSIGWKKDFLETKKIFAKLGIKNIELFFVDRDFSKSEEKKLLTSNAIYLDGGNTFYFLHFLRKSKLLGKLKKYVKNGGTLIGLSAGSILITPTIDMAAIPRFDRDPNHVRLNKRNSLGLVNFEFYPHYEEKVRVDRALQRHSKRSPRPLFACSDGDGILVRNKKLKFIGRVYRFYRGQKELIN